MLMHVPAQSASRASVWVHGNLSQVRLIAGRFDGKTYSAGVEIRLKGKAHTYWRNPGDGGVPPIFNFSKSGNLKSAQAFFPPPKRSGVPGEEVIGYEHRVVFPLRVVPSDTSRPVVLDLKFNYAACEKICVPELAQLQLQLDPASIGQNGSPEATLITAFEGKLPKPFSAAGAPGLSISSKQAGKTWIIAVTGAGEDLTDLFVEGPDGWYFDQKLQSPAFFELKLAQKPENAKKIPPLFFTLTTKTGAFEGTFPLP